MENDLDKQTNTLVALLIFAVSIMVLLLIIFIIFNSIKNSDISTISGTITETGWLNSSGYTLSHSGATITEVRNISNNAVLPSSDYFLIGNKIYNNTNLC